jgi:hypothetical protein
LQYGYLGNRLTPVVVTRPNIGSSEEWLVSLRKEQCDNIDSQARLKAIGYGTSCSMR